MSRRNVSHYSREREPQSFHNPPPCNKASPDAVALQSSNMETKEESSSQERERETRNDSRAERARAPLCHLFSPRRFSNSQRRRERVSQLLTSVSSTVAAFFFLTQREEKSTVSKVGTKVHTLETKGLVYIYRQTSYILRVGRRLFPSSIYIYTQAAHAAEYVCGEKTMERGDGKRW